MTLKDASKRIPLFMIQSIALSNAPPYLREQIAEIQRAADKSEKERRLAESLGLTVRELRILNNPLFSASAVDRMGVDVNEVKE